MLNLPMDRLAIRRAPVNTVVVKTQRTTVVTISGCRVSVGLSTFGVTPSGGGAIDENVLAMAKKLPGDKWELKKVLTELL